MRTAVVADARRAGMVTMAPFVVAYAPFALVVGAAVAAHGDPVAGWAGSWLIYGGSAHLATLQTIDRNGALLAVVTGLLVNARLVVYSASLARRWQAQPRWFRVVGGALLIDPTWAVAERQPVADPEAERAFFLAAGITLGVGWSLMIAAGALAGDHLPDVGLPIVAPLCLAALLGSRLLDGSSVAVAIAATTASVAAAGAPAGTDLLIAIIAGCIAGAAADQVRS